MYEAEVSPQLSKQHVLRMVVLQYMDFYKHYSSMLISMDNRHQLYIEALVLYRPKYIQCMHHQRVQASICMKRRDYRHDIERLVHNCMDLGNVH